MNKVEVSARNPITKATYTVIDGCILLWIPQWPLDFVKHHIQGW